MGIFDSTITVNGRVFPLGNSADSSLLELLAGLDIHLPAGCGGHGSCGLCRCRVLGDAPGLDPLEQPYLDPAEVETGVRLACRHGLGAGMSIEVPQAVLAARRLAGRVAALEELSPGVCRLTVRLMGAGPDFQPGQWARLELPAGGAVEHRAFSYASAPSVIADGLAAFIIKRVPGGRLTTLVHEGLRNGDPMAVVGPYGDFRALPQGGRPLLWVAGGSGLAPFVSALRVLESAGGPGAAGVPRIRLLFAAHEPADLFLDGWLRELAAAWPDFEYVPFVSALPTGSVWPGLVGRLPAVLRAELAALPGGASGWDACVVGTAGFVEAGRGLLRAAGVPPPQIHHERFI
jgi:ferredoxin-NADP reductase/ferredoxin